METIRLSTWIDAPVERCFLLSLSIDLHLASTRTSGEAAIAGVKEGLIGEGESVTFQGRNYGLLRQHTSRIETLRPHSYFRAVMVAGSFQHFEHDHHFAAMDDGTRIRDEIRFLPPRGLVGRLTARFVRRRLKACLIEHNAMIKRVAESDNEWRKYLDKAVSSSPTVVPVKNETTRRWEGSSLLGASRRVAVTRPPTG
jgi:ligand-binding SRPBCC domain-containing protein